MSLLKLTPEAERLRRLAKAHAAGEIATPEYRQMRADVILRFAEDGGGEDTSDVTERRAPEPLRPSPLPSTPSTPARPPGAREPQFRWRRYGLAVAALLLGWLIAALTLG